MQRTEIVQTALNKGFILEETKNTENTAENTSPTDLKALTKEELISIVESQRAEIDELDNPPPNDWHSMAYAMFHIILYRFKLVNIKHEFPLGAQPPRADFIVVDDNETIDLDSAVFKIFRKTNIIEFKSPDDELSEQVLWKVVGYAGLYIAKYGADDRDITITLLRDTKPVKLLKELEDFVEAEDADDENGIYYIKGWKVDFPIQIVVTSSLKGKDNAGFRAISKNPRIEDIEQLLLEVSEAKDSDLIGWFRDFLDLFSRLDSETVEEMKRRDPDMARTWRDIFGVDAEVDAAVSSARADERANTTRTIYFSLVQDGDLTIDRAAQKSGMTTDQFRQQMEEYNRTHSSQEQTAQTTQVAQTV